MFTKIVIVFGVILSLFFGFAFHLAGGSLVIKEVFKHQPKENLEFRFSSCEGHVSGREKVIRNEIINGRLEVNAKISLGCGTIWMFGDYEIEGDKVTLLYKPVLGSVLACMCSYEVEYVIDEFPLKAYEVEIKSQEELYSDISWFYNLLGF